MSSEQKNSSNDTDWKLKLNDLVQTCQSELKKTTKIGMKMLTASQANAQLHEAYQELGKWAFNQVQEKKLSDVPSEILEVMEKVKTLEGELENIEQDVQDIKKEP